MVLQFQDIQGGQTEEQEEKSQNIVLTKATQHNSISSFRNGSHIRTFKDLRRQIGTFNTEPGGRAETMKSSFLIVHFSRIL